MAKAKIIKAEVGKPEANPRPMVQACEMWLVYYVNTQDPDSGHFWELWAEYISAEEASAAAAEAPSFPKVRIVHFTLPGL